jgi:hypothetical protein
VDPAGAVKNFPGREECICRLLSSGSAGSQPGETIAQQMISARKNVRRRLAKEVMSFSVTVHSSSKFRRRDGLVNPEMAARRHKKHKRILRSLCLLAAIHTTWNYWYTGASSASRDARRAAGGCGRDVCHPAWLRAAYRRLPGSSISRQRRALMYNEREGAKR